MSEYSAKPTTLWRIHWESGRAYAVDVRWNHNESWGDYFSQENLHAYMSMIPCHRVRDIENDWFTSEAEALRYMVANREAVLARTIAQARKDIKRLRDVVRSGRTQLAGAHP